MARVVRLSPLFLGRLKGLGVRRGSPAAAAVGATIAALAESKRLPGLLDTSALVPPTTSAFVRRVAGRNLWLWYRVTATELAMVTVTSSPPVPVRTR